MTSQPGQDDDDDAAEDLDCPICLDPMNAADALHPLQCTNACGYNFCNVCIESLITSSKDDYAEASDGNMHVKVFLHCPNCRSDLGTTIRDTVLLRKADHIAECATRGGDEELTASELRMKGVMDDDEVRAAIAEARRREADFLGKKYEDETDSEAEEGRDDCAGGDEEEVEECGVEADLIRGVHQSMRWPKAPQPQIGRTKSSLKRIDATLLAGLEFAMSPDEQEVVTELMTSGDVDKLASAAEILHGITDMARQGKTPAQREAIAPRGRRGRGDGRSSVFMLIDEANKIREQASSFGGGGGEDQKLAHEVGTVAAAAAARGPARAAAPKNSRPSRNVITASQHRAAELSLRRQMEFMKLYPLPVRMPKYVEVTLMDPTSRRFALGFIDDMWDGTVLDAYSKITITGTKAGRKDNVKRRHPNNKGVYKILNLDADDDSFTNPRIDTPDQPRALVSYVKAEGGRQGVVKGDVVTHVNGEGFSGTVEDLVALIRAAAERNDGHVLRLVLNAGPATADALRRRASVMGD